MPGKSNDQESVNVYKDIENLEIKTESTEILDEYCVNYIHKYIDPTALVKKDTLTSGTFGLNEAPRRTTGKSLSCLPSFASCFIQSARSAPK